MQTRIASLIVLTAGLLAACGGSIRPRTLAPDAREQLRTLEQHPASTGDQIYEGRVYALDGRPEPLFRYERRVRAEGDVLTSTHITHDATGAVVVTQSASHSPTYELQRADLVHGQSGVRASVAIANGEATYTLDDGEERSVSRERVDAPMVAGPTMFGFILAHWDQLRNGAAIPFRFAVLERGESYGFVLDQVEAPAGRTTIRMTPTSWLVRLAVAPTYFQFETASRNIVEYSGLVPPFERRGETLVTLDARVAYDFVAPAFR